MFWHIPRHIFRNLPYIPDTIQSFRLDMETYQETEPDYILIDRSLTVISLTGNRDIRLLPSHRSAGILRFLRNWAEQISQPLTSNTWQTGSQVWRLMLHWLINAHYIFFLPALVLSVFFNVKDFRTAVNEVVRISPRL